MTVPQVTGMQIQPCPHSSMPSCTTSGFTRVMTSSITPLYTEAVEESCILYGQGSQVSGRHVQF